MTFYFHLAKDLGEEIRMHHIARRQLSAIFSVPFFMTIFVHWCELIIPLQSASLSLSSSLIYFCHKYHFQKSLNEISWENEGVWTRKRHAIPCLVVLAVVLNKYRNLFSQRLFFQVEWLVLSQWREAWVLANQRSAVSQLRLVSSLDMFALINKQHFISASKCQLIRSEKLIWFEIIV